MQSSIDGRIIDRAAMIEAASRNLRQQMGRQRDRPHSKGSFHDAHSSTFAASSASNDLRARAPASSEQRSMDNSQRRIRSAENDHRIFVQSQPPGVPRESTPVSASMASSQPSSALDNYPVEDESSQQYFAFEDIPSGDLKRPLSRKKDPSASAAAGLGAFSSPVKMTDAFEQKKSRQPIPVESWGPRPPSRHGAKAAGLDASALVEEERGVPMQHPVANARSRSETGPTSGVGGTWAAARYAPMHDARRGRDRKTRNRSSPEDLGSNLGIFGTNSMGRSPSSQQLAKSFSGVLDHSIPEKDVLTSPTSFISGSLGQDAGSWASHVNDGNGPLEVSGLSLSDAATPWSNASASASGAAPWSNASGSASASGATPWPSSPTGGGSPLGGSPPTRKGARQSETVSVEDVEGDVDGVFAHSFRRDATPPQIIVTRSSQQKKDRGDSRRGREERTRERAKSMPFSTGLDPDFLRLFAS